MPDKSTIAEVLAMLDELDQIRSIYGDDCVACVKAALWATHPSARWGDVVVGAVNDWVALDESRQHGLMV